METITIYEKYEAVSDFVSKSKACGSDLEFNIKKGMIFHRVKGSGIDSRYSNEEFANKGQDYDVLEISKKMFFKPII